MRWCSGERGRSQADVSSGRAGVRRLPAAARGAVHGGRGSQGGTTDRGRVRRQRRPRRPGAVSCDPLRGVVCQSRRGRVAD